MEVGSLISELKRRRVFRVLVGYGIVSFAVYAELPWQASVRPCYAAGLR